MKNFIKDERAENPLEIMLTVIVSTIILIGFNFVYGLTMDGFIFQLDKSSGAITQIILQESYGHLMTLASISFQIPAFVFIMLIVWSIKSIIRKQFFTQTGEVKYVDDY